jgi:hypothetical protein
VILDALERMSPQFPQAPSGIEDFRKALD